MTWANGDGLWLKLKVPIVGYGSAARIYSQQCQNNPTACENEFSAKVSSTDVVSDETLNWINGDCTNATTGVSTCVPNAGIFTVVPNCQCTLTVDGECYFSASTSTASSLVFVQENSSGTGANLGMSIFCQKQGADFKAQNVITGTFAEMMKVPGVSKPKTCYYAFGGASATLAAPTECTTGTCVEVYDSCNAVTPPTFDSAGFYTNLTFANGTWANSSPLKCDCVAFDVTTGSTRQCWPLFVTSDNTWSSTSSGGYVGNFASYNSAGTSQDSYVQVKCEGQAP